MYPCEHPEALGPVVLRSASSVHRLRAYTRTRRKDGEEPLTGLAFYSLSVSYLKLSLANDEHPTCYTGALERIPIRRLHCTGISNVDMSSYILWLQYKLTKKGFTGGLLPSLDLKRCCVTESYHMPHSYNKY